MRPSLHIAPPPMQGHSIDFLLGHMWTSLNHLSGGHDTLQRELEEQKKSQDELKERMDMIDRRWRSLAAWGAALLMITANLLDKDGLRLLAEAVGLVK